MPRNGAGIYTLPEGSFVPGTVISSDAMNSDLSDIALALTGSVAADGQTPITGSFLLADGTYTDPSYSFVTGTGDGMYHPAAGLVGIAINGLPAFIFQPPSVDAGFGIGLLNNAVNPVPVGIILDFAGSSAPAGWLLCYGQAVDRDAYDILFDVIGTTYGSGNGTTTFNVPDLRGRSTSGKDDMGGAAAGRVTSAGSGIDGETLGADGGEQTHTLITGELAAHGHSVSVTDPGHTHEYVKVTSVSGVTGGAGTNQYSVSNQQTGSATTGITATATNTGSGTAHNNMQPTVIINKIIYTGSAG